MADSHNQKEWCWGLPLVGARPLTPNERAELQVEATQGARGCWLFGCALPLLFFVAMCGMAMLLDNTALGKIESVGIVFAVLIITVPAVVALRANDLAGQSKDARRDLAGDRVCLYGQADAAPEPVPLNKDEVTLQNIEVLGASRRLWSVNGTRFVGHDKAPAATIADVPDAALLSARWTPPLRIESDGTIEIDSLNQRELSLAEREELARLAKRWRRAFWPALGLSLWLAIPISLHFWGGQPITHKPGAYVLAISTAVALFNMARAVREALELRQAEREGVAVILRRPEQEDLSWSYEAQVVEVLPASGIQWSVDGVPSSWRGAA